MIESLRRITRVEMGSPHFTGKAPAAGYTEALSSGVAAGPSEALELLPLQSVTVDIKCTLCVFKDTQLASMMRGRGQEMALSPNDPASAASMASNRALSWATSPSGNYFTNTTIPTPPLMSAQAAKYFLTDFGEDNILDAWIACVRTMVLLPYLAELDTSTYTLQLQQAASQWPHSMTNASFLTSNVQIDKTPVLPPQELTGTVTNYPPDYAKLAAANNGSTVPIGLQLLEGLLSGAVPAPTVSFRLAFTVPNIDEGPKMFGVMLTLLNTPAIISSTPLPLGCLPLGTVIAPAILDHLLALTCSSRRIGPNRVLVACKASSRVPKRGAMVEEAMYRNVFLTNLYFDAPSSCMGKSLASMAQLPHDPQQRLAATHHTAPLIQALVRSIDVTPVRQTADYFPITLRKYESYNFVFMIELKPEFAFLASYASKLATAIPPQMPTSLQQQQNNRRSMALSKGGNYSVGTVNRSSNNPLMMASPGLSSAASPKPLAVGVIGIGANLHEKRLGEQIQKQQQQLQALHQRQVSTSLVSDASHQRTNSIFRYRSGGGALKGISPVPTPKNAEDPMSPLGGEGRRRGHYISGDMSEYTTPSARHMRGSTARGTLQVSNTSDLASMGIPDVGYANMSHEDLLLFHILQDTIETTVVLSYEIDASVSSSSRATSAAPAALPQEGQPQVDEAKGTPLAEASTSPSASSQAPKAATFPNNTLSMRWQAPVKWAFSSRQYDSNGNIIPVDLGAQQMLDHNTSADLAWLNVSTPTNAF
eukprot:GILI01019839.1.p1 GENE.GILI01019839.1~~GILI01019839.1.p1  ORF type:complete len:763 (-),score=151.96 GILI01019839.1:81-2369(-)